MVALVSAVACGDGGSVGPDASSSGFDGGAAEGAAVDVTSVDAGSHADCIAAARVGAIASCIDGGGAPRDCAAQSPGPDACDDDGDGMDDGLEDAMARSYAPVFAYNLGDGSHQKGSSEPIWPANPSHYASHSTLIWRVDNNSSTVQSIAHAPKLDDLPLATYQAHKASDPALGEGPNFWLCLDQVNGSYPADALVTSMSASSALAGGVDLAVVVHPTGTDPNGRYAVLGYMALYAYNQFTLDDHEGDWEGGAVFVDMTSGDVVAIDTERHATADTEKLVPLVGSNAAPAVDPSNDPPKYDVCSATDVPRGVRFWDFAGVRHHPVFYTAAGSHATYAYPGATKIQGIGCVELSIIRDVHNGQNARLVPHLGGYANDWTGAALTPVNAGVHVVNVGERSKLRATWTAFAGQWGCQLETIPKSYPGPWDNDRLCRHWLTNDWGNAPPFTPSTSTTCP